MRILTLTLAVLLTVPTVSITAQETLTEKTKDAASAAKDAAVKTGKTVEHGAKKVAEEAKELFKPEEARKVPVTLKEHSIDVPAKIDAGKTRFAVTNSGSKKHSFEIEGEGIDKKFWISVSPGEMKNLDVELKPGDYTVYCPLDDHAEKGMKRKLVAQ